jgi:hypothetical protein
MEEIAPERQQHTEEEILAIEAERQKARLRTTIE